MAAEAVNWTLRQFGVRSCAGRMAKEFGDHPDAAASRMRWVRQLAKTGEADDDRMTSRGRPERRTGPLVRFPAPTMAVLSPERGLRRAPLGEVGVPDQVSGRPRDPGAW
jgi:hypothetical protein